jgi:hypothetical protein
MLSGDCQESSNKFSIMQLVAEVANLGPRLVGSGAFQDYRKMILSGFHQKMK